MRLALVLILLFISSLALGQRNADQWYAAGQAAMKQSNYSAAASAFRNAVKQNPTAANWRWLGEAYAKLEDYDNATKAFDQAIAKYRAKNDLITARALENRTNPFRQQGEVYIWQPVQKAAKLALLEPNNGVLMGMYVDETGLNERNEINLKNRFDSSFAVYFRYHKLIKPNQSNINRQFFPTRFYNAVRKANGMVHLAIEPSTPLAQVSADVLESFAKAVRDSGVPTFIRFAGEFNDPSNEWSKNPALYVQKFRLVAKTFHDIAPNAVIVWMPMASRLEVLDKFYPGENYVDWVGVSMYSTPFANGDLKQNNIRVSPLDQLKPIYEKYANKHPIQISEYAASHETLLTPNADYTDYAVQKMNMLYWGVAQRYPRIKNINWLDIDMIRSKFITPSRAAERRNNYQLVGTKLETMKALLLNPIFIRNDAIEPTVMPSRFPNRILARVPFDVTAWIKTFDPLPAKVQYLLNNKVVAESRTIPYIAKLPALEKGKHNLELRVFGAKNKLLLLRTQVFQAE
jgi:tetratricopeptide (TPR) repeat protein